MSWNIVSPIESVKIPHRNYYVIFDGEICKIMFYQDSGKIWIDYPAIIGRPAGGFKTVDIKSYVVYLMDDSGRIKSVACDKQDNIMVIELWNRRQK